MSNNPRVTKLIYPNYNKVDENTNVIKEYVYNNSTPIATMTSTKTYKVYADHLNTSRRVADNTNNQIIWKWESSPFGETKATGTITHNLRFPGQYFDSETKMHYNINRDYNPVTGRYIQSDPIGFDGGVNGFGYANANSLVYRDVMGLVHLNFFSKEYEEGMWVAANNTWEDNSFSIGGHGSVGIINRYTTSQAGYLQVDTYNASELAVYIQNDGRYHNYGSITLFSCEAGSKDANGKSLAQELANSLDKDVIGSIGTCFYYQNYGVI